MEAEIMSEMSGNHLLLTSDSISGEEYENKMFRYNTIKGFLPYSVNCINNRITYQYGIGEYESLADVFGGREFFIEDIKFILLWIETAGNLCGEYLLNRDYILLDPRFIYMTGEELSFCYYPDKENSFNRGMRKLMEYILERLNHDNPEEVMIAYSIYQKVLKNNYTIETLMDEFFKNHETIKTEKEKNTEKGKNTEASENEQGRIVFGKEENAERSNTENLMLLEQEILEFKDDRAEKKNRIKEKKSGNIISFFRRKKNNKKEYNQEHSTILLAENTLYNAGAVKISLINNSGKANLDIMNFPAHIGSTEGDSQYTINNRMVSRHHAVITWECGSYYVEDEGSSNGTFVNESRIPPFEPVQINQGDVIAFANEKYTLN